MTDENQRRDSTSGSTRQTRKTTPLGRLAHARHGRAGSCRQTKSVDASQPTCRPVPTGDRLVHQLQVVDCKRLKSATHSVSRTARNSRDPVRPERWAYPSATCKPSRTSCSAPVPREAAHFARKESRHSLTQRTESAIRFSPSRWLLSVSETSGDGGKEPARGTSINSGEKSSRITESPDSPRSLF